MRGERGFTLVEVLTAMLILTFVITSSLWAFLERNKRLQQASEIVLAYQALANESEYWRREPFATLQDDPKFLSKPDELLAPLAPFHTEVNVQITAAGVVKHVTLIIRWRNDEREARLGVVRVHTGGNGTLW
jgi:prepilin-type N-terminal cleavage/methylation domain-containing protein